MKLGIQLYTVRDRLEEDFEGTLRAIKDMGYDGVEFAWMFGGKTPEELAKFVEQDLGLLVCGFHLKTAEATNAKDPAWTYALALKSPYVTVSLAGWVEERWDEAIATVKEAGKIAKKKGLQFTYHHHAQEFADKGGKYALDVLLEATDPEEVKLELDTYWIRKGGEDPVAYLRTKAGRVPQLHVKDMAKDGSFAEVGEGEIDFPAVIEAADEARVPWLIVEQDKCARPSIESAEISAKNLKKMMG